MTRLDFQTIKLRLPSSRSGEYGDLGCAAIVIQLARYGEKSGARFSLNAAIPS